MLVKFDIIVSSDDVIQGGLFYFDKKFVIMKEWFFDVELCKSKINSVLIWVKFYGFDIKYQSLVNLSKIGSLLGKLMMVDKKY